MKKTFELSPTKAIRVEPVLIGQKPYINLRQLYKTKNDPQWKIGRQGIMLDQAEAEAIARYITKYAGLPVDDYTELNLDRDKEEKPVSRTAAKKPKAKAKPSGKTVARKAKSKSRPTAKAGKKTPPWEK